jgi:hypothetical protein
MNISRTREPRYPAWGEPMYPGIEHSGPEEFSLESLEQWLHPDQAEGVVKGWAIHNRLRTGSNYDAPPDFSGGGGLVDCIGLLELHAIQSARGAIDLFHDHFPKKAVFAWRAVVAMESGMLLVPSLFVIEGKEGGPGTLARIWRPVNDRFRKNSPALRFPSGE